MMRLAARAGLMAFVWTSAAAAAAVAADTYVGEITIAGATRPLSMPITVTIRDYTSDEKAMALAEVLHKDGHVAAMGEMMKADMGTVRLGDGANVRVALARQETTATGRTLRIVTDRPLQPTGPAAAPPDTVGFVELTLDAAGAGSGRLLTAVKATFDAEGFVVPESHGETWVVANVKPGP